MTNLKEVSVEEFKAAHGQDATVIDVREQNEFDECHVKGVQLFPLSAFDAQSVVSGLEGDGPIYVLCKAGGRAKKAAVQMAPHTTRELCVVVGGTDACVEAGVAVG